MIINDLPKIMMRCLLLTIIFELIISIIIGVRDKKDILNIILVNILTNPLVVTIPVYFNIKYGLFERNIALYTLEIITVVTEGYIYKKVLNFKKINPFVISLILNLSSYLIGEIINYIL